MFSLIPNPETTRRRPARDQSRRRWTTVDYIVFLLVDILTLVVVVKDLWLRIVLSPIALLISRKLRLDGERTRREKMKELVPYVGLLDGGDECSICMRDPLFRCHSSCCGHSFCGPCILYYWDPNEAFTPYRCFICENPITELIPDAVMNLKEHVNIRTSVEQYNNLMVIGRSGFFQQVVGLPLILKTVYCLAKLYDDGDYHMNPRLFHFALKIHVILAALARCYPLTLLPKVSYFSVTVVLVLYYGYVIYLGSARKRRSTHYWKWR